MTPRAALHFLPLASFSRKRESILILVPRIEEPELPLSFGQRVTFFAGAKKVTKETPFKSEPSQEGLLGCRKRCAKFHSQLGFGKLTRAFANSKPASSSWSRVSTFENERANLRQKNRLCDSPAHFRFALRQTWACSDSKRHFFGDFLCASKESYPLVRRNSGSSCFSTPRTAVLSPAEKRTKRSVS